MSSRIGNTLKRKSPVTSQLRGLYRKFSDLERPEGPMAPLKASLCISLSYDFTKQHFSGDFNTRPNLGGVLTVLASNSYGSRLDNYPGRVRFPFMHR